MAVSNFIIVYSVDGVQWKDYICQNMDEARYKLKVEAITDTQLFSAPTADSKTKCDLASCVLVIVSPNLLNTMESDSSCSFVNIISTPTNAILLFCGIGDSDMDSPEMNFRDRFPQYNYWKQTHTKTPTEIFTKIIKTVDNAEKVNAAPIPKQRPKKQNVSIVKEVIPKQIKCEEITEVVILFKSELPECRISVLLSSMEDDKDLQLIEAFWLNRFTAKFLTPEHVQGLMKVKVLKGEQDGTFLGETTIEYVSSTSHLSGIVAAHVEVSNLLLDVLSATKHAPQQLDQKLRRHWSTRVKELPERSVDQIFGMHYYAKPNADELYDCPTLLHLAARHHLPEFLTILLGVTESAQACMLQDKHGMVPQQIAEKAGLKDLAGVIASHVDLDDKFSDIYEIMMRPLYDHYYNLRKRSAPGYLTMDSIVPQNESQEKPDETYEEMMTPRPERPDECAEQKPKLLPRSESTGSEKDTKTSMPCSQRDLVEIMNMVKSNQLTIDQAQTMFVEWKQQYESSGTSSVKDKQNTLQKMQEEIQCAENAIRPEPTSKTSIFHKLGKALRPTKQKPPPVLPRPAATFKSSDKPSESRRSRDMDVVDEEVDSEYLELTDTSVYRHSSSSNCSRDSGVSTDGIENRNSSRKKSVRESMLQDAPMDIAPPPLPPRRPPKQEKTSRRPPVTPPP